MRIPTKKNIKYFFNHAFLFAPTKPKNNAASARKDIPANVSSSHFFLKMATSWYGRAWGRYDCIFL